MAQESKDSLMGLGHLISSPRTAFLIGNGINRYLAKPSSNSWEELLYTIARKSILDEFQAKTFVDELKKALVAKRNDISYPEIYDLICLKSGNHTNFNELKNYIVAEMSKWQPSETHRAVAGFAQIHGIPILTTNYDKCFEHSVEFQKHHYEKFHSRHYPYTTYYSPESINKDIHNSFAVWHIHGVIDYRDSIRIGATDYTNMASHLKKYESLFVAKTKQPDNQDIPVTWLNIFHDNNLVIFGLGLDVQETVLRYLLIQRMRSQKNSGVRTVYVCTKKDAEKNFGKQFFLNNIGIEILEVDDWKQWYKLFR